MFKIMLAWVGMSDQHLTWPHRPEHHAAKSTAAIQSIHQQSLPDDTATHWPPQHPGLCPKSSNIKSALPAADCLPPSRCGAASTSREATHCLQTHALAALTHNTGDAAERSDAGESSSPSTPPPESLSNLNSTHSEYSALDEAQSQPSMLQSKILLHPLKGFLPQTCLPQRLPLGICCFPFT